MAFAPKDKSSRVDSRPKSKSAAKILEQTPAEYQASVYAKLQKQRRQKATEKKKKNLAELRNKLKELKIKFAMLSPGPGRETLKDEISKIEAAIKKAPRPKRQWSSILPGSFESGKR